MLRIGRGLAWLVAGLLLLGLVLPACADDTGTPQTASAPSTPSAHHRSSKKKAPPPLVLPPLPAGPLQQVPLPQIPESAPKVTLENGQLTIVAHNATLGDILKQVQQLTNASIDLPPNGASERVVTQIGPGAPRDVLATLLNGTAFNYVMLGSSSDPTAIATVVLSPKPGAVEAQTAANGYPQGGQPMVQTVPGQQPFRQQAIAAMPPQPEAAAAEEDNADDSEDKDQDADADQAGQPTPPDNNAQPDQQNPNLPNAGPRTPEQLLQMMRQGQPAVPPNGQPPQQ